MCHKTFGNAHVHIYPPKYPLGAIGFDDFGHPIWANSAEGKAAAEELAKEEARRLLG
jgi:hypothetical protein